MSLRYPNYQTVTKQTATDEQSPVNKYAQTDFSEAGVDNATSASAQDPEMFEALSNVRPIDDGSIRRRPGYAYWMNPGAPTQHFYDYQSDVTGKREVILTAANYVRAQNDDGSDYNTDLFTPVVQAAAPRSVVSRSYAYFADGQEEDYLKWDGSATNGMSKWGIDINDTGAGTTAGPEAPFTVTDVGAGGPSGSIGPLLPAVAANVANTPDSPAWTAPGNAKVFDGQVATVSVEGGSSSPGPGTASGTPSDYLQTTDFGFNVPGSATITGVIAEVYRYDGGANQNDDKEVNLIVNGVIVGANKAAYGSPGVFGAWLVYGGASDLWGMALTPADINANDFGLSYAVWNTTEDSWSTDEFGNPIENLGGHGADNTYVDAMRITVYYDMPPAIASWTDPDNIKIEDGLVATAEVTTSETSQLQASDFGFSIAGGDAITGIQVNVKCAATETVQLRLNLLKNGILYGEVKSHPVTSASLAFLSYGNASDLWAGVWTPTDLNALNFGISLTALKMAGAAEIEIDYVEIIIYLGTGSLTLGAATAAGDITLIDGRVYYAVFSNSLTPHYSDLTPPSNSTGPLTTEDQPISNIPVSVDPQVDTVVLLATADAGDATRLYLLASLPNGTTTYTDTMDELTLLTQPVYLSTDLSGEEFGVTGNNPPPVGALYPTKHRGRIYLLNGPTLHWSKALEDITTDTSLIAGRWEESFPGENSTDISDTTEAGRGMLSDGINLYIGTEFKIRRLNGDAPFLESPDIVHNEVGIMNQDVWRITYLEGTPVGAMWLTPDLRVISSDFNTYKDIGSSIDGTLASINTEAVKEKAYATFYANATLDLYILAIPTGASAVNNTLCVFNLRSQKWFTWTFTDDVSALFYHILRTGVPQLLIASEADPIYQLSMSATQDRVNNTPVAFPVVAKTSWLDLSDPLLRKSLNEIEVITGDPFLTILTEGATTLSDFAAPHTVATRLVKLSPRGEYKIYLAGSTSRDRFYRLTFISTGVAQTILSSYTVESVPVNRQ